MDALHTQLSMINIPFDITGIIKIFLLMLICKGTLCTLSPLRVHVVDVLFTVQAIRNITNFRGKNSYEFIRTNFVLKFVHEIREKFVHEFVRESMPEDYFF